MTAHTVAAAAAPVAAAPQIAGALKVRLADRDDEENLMHLCRQLHGENALFPMDEDIVRRTLWHAFDRKGGIVGVIGNRGDLEGMIYMLIGRLWYTEREHLEELFNYVRPDIRNASPPRAHALVSFAKHCSDELALPLIIGVVSNIRTEAKVRIYQRYLGKPAGAFFVYPPPDAVVGEPETPEQEAARLRRSISHVERELSALQRRLNQVLPPSETEEQKDSRLREEITERQRQLGRERVRSG